MNKTWKIRLAGWAMAVLCTLALPLPALAAEEAPDREAAAQAAAELAMTYGGATSVQYALWQDGEITLSGHAGVYSKTENRALTGDMLYGVGSISKVYTAAMVMRLVEEGKVALDAPVTRYLPDFTMADERYRDITVRMLLNHSSGLMGSAGPNSFLLGDGSYDAAEDILDRLAGQTLQADPGAYSVYSNDSFTLADLLIQRVTGMEYEECLTAYITEPLGLEHTFTPADDFDRDLLARTYLLPTDTVHTPPETLAVVGCGGIYASAEDLAAFGGAFCGDSLLRESSRAAMAAEEYSRGMWPEDSEDDLLAYGLGWDNVHLYPFNRSGIQALVKGGDTVLYHAGLVVLPECGMACAVLSSGGVSTYNQLAAARILIDALAEEGVAVAEEGALDEAAPAPMPAELTACSGWYGTSTMAGRVDISADGVLTLSLSGAEQTFTYREDGSFRDEGNTALLKPVEEENGRVYLFQKGYALLPGLTWTCSANYVLERLPDCAAPAEAQAAWEAREGKVYVQLNERYTSILYPAGSVFARVSLEGMPEGYLLTNQLTAADEAVPVLQIPGTGSRDSGTIRVEEIGGVEHLEINGGLYRDAAALETIYPGERSRCTIQPDGYARWYRVGEAAGSTMTVTLPEQGGFAVYGADFLPVAASWTYGYTQAVLPEGGYVVFAGEAGSVFRIVMDRP